MPDPMTPTERAEQRVQQEPPLFVPASKIAEELAFVDADIRQAFEGTAYMTGLPSLLQFCRVMREWTQGMRTRREKRKK